MGGYRYVGQRHLHILIRVVQAFGIEAPLYILEKLGWEMSKAAAAQLGRVVVVARTSVCAPKLHAMHYCVRNLGAVNGVRLHECDRRLDAAADVPVQIYGSMWRKIDLPFPDLENSVGLWYSVTNGTCDVGATPPFLAAFVPDLCIHACFSRDCRSNRFNQSTQV